MRLFALRISMLVIWSILLIGCAGLEQTPSQPQAKSFFATHDVFYLSPLIDGSPYRLTRIYGYQLDKSSGIATPVPGSPYTLADGAAGQLMSKVGPMDSARRFLLAVRENGQGKGAEIELFKISAQDGSLVLTSSQPVPPVSVKDLNFDSTGHFVYASVDGLNGNSIFSFRIDDSKLTPIAVTPVPFEADFPRAIAYPGRPLLLVYGTLEIQTDILDSIVIQHFATFHIDEETGALIPTGHTYSGTDLPFLVAGIDGPANFLFAGDLDKLREFSLHDDGSIEEMTSNALPYNVIGSPVFQVFGNPEKNVIYMRTDTGQCEITLGNYDPQTGAMSLSQPLAKNCEGIDQLAAVTPNFLFGTNTELSPPLNTAVVIRRLDPNGNIISESYFQVF
jgi:hypothetical protein